MYFALSGTSLGAVLITSYAAFSIIRWIGAAYLMCLSVAAFVGTSPVFSVSSSKDTPIPRSRIFVNGFVLQASNPKALLFFTALLPQFIEPRASVVTQV